MTILRLLIENPGIAIAGLGLGLSLIVAIGAQNAYVLRQSALREHVLAVLLVCILSDATLILAGVAGLGAIIDHAPWAITMMRWLGVAFLTGYGLLAARRAWRPSGRALDAGGDAPEQAHPASGTDAEKDSSATAEAPVLTATRTRATTGRGRLLPVVLTTLALTWLNPHVYLDTVVLIGSVANTHGPDGRWVFAIGACLGSVVWFTALGFGARLLSRRLSSPQAWRVLDGLIALVMLGLALMLAIGA